MGWDPTVKLLEGDFYRINVGYAQYQTVGILQVHGTDDLLGCGARIFKVKKVEDTEDDTETTIIRSRTLESSEDVSLPFVIPSRNTSRNSKTYTTHSDMEDGP